MTVQSIATIKERVSVAEQDSKIAVFLVQRGGTKELDAMFESTVKTKARIKKGDTTYIGSYWKYSDKKQMKEQLGGAIC